jgi:hypothetical protein
MKKRCHQRTYTQPAEIEKIDAVIIPINFGITWQKTPKLSLAALFRAVYRCFEVGGGCWAPRPGGGDAAARSVAGQLATGSQLVALCPSPPEPPD